MKKNVILFSYFIDSFNSAANLLYDLRPLVNKQFSGKEIKTLFHRFEDILCQKDPFWEKSEHIMYIDNFYRIQSLELEDSKDYVLIDNYKFHNDENKKDYWLLIDGTSLSFDSIQDKYSSCLCLADSFYGFGYYDNHILPRWKQIISAVIEIFDLKMFPKDFVQMIKLKRIDYATKDCKNRLNLDLLMEYMDTAGDYCPENLKKEISIQIDTIKKILTKMDENCKAMVSAVNKAIDIENTNMSIW